VACFVHGVHGHGAAAAPMPFAEPGVQAHYGPSYPARIVHASITLHLHPEERRFEGEARIRLERYPTWAGEVAFDLDEVDVSSVEVDGAAVEFTHRDGKLRVLAELCPQVVVIAWSGENPQRGLYFTGPTPSRPDRQHMAWTQSQDEDAHFFLPCFDHPRVKHPWSITLTAPAGTTLLSNGALGESGEKDGRSWATFEQSDPMPAYLFTAVAAKLTRFDRVWRDREVRYFVPVGEEEHVERAMGRTPEMMELFSTLTGVPFPWPRYDQVVVHDFIFGGMENTACTTMIDLLLIDEASALHWEPDGLVAHELAHQWFGDLVTCQDWSQAWLNESFATFLEQVWYEHAHGESDGSWYAYKAANAYFAEANGRYLRPIVTYDFREPIDVFDRHLYEKGACVLRTLRGDLGADVFWTGIRNYLERHSHGTVHSRHLIRAIEDATGRNLDAFLHQFVLSAGHPVLDVALGQEPGLVTVSVKQTQSGDGWVNAYHFTLPVEIVSDNGSRRALRLKVTDREKTFAIPVGERVQTIRVDPDFSVFAQVTLSGPTGMLEALASDERPVLAIRAVEALARKNNREAWKIVGRQLSQHPHPAARIAAAEAIGARGGEPALNELAQALAAEPDPRVLEALARALGALRDPRAGDALLARLGAAGSAHARGAILQALGASGDARAIEACTQALGLESWGEIVRVRALEGLARTEDPSVLPVLIERSGAHHPDRVRGAAAAAMATLADKVESARTPAVDRLGRMLFEPGFRSLFQAIDALARLRDPRSVGPLTRAHEGASDARVRRAAYEALVNVRQGRTTEAGLASLRGRIDAVEGESRKLRDRLDRTERHSG
jgi:aminopeptidase N